MQFIQKISATNEKMPRTGRQAIVCGRNELLFGLMRQFQIMTEGELQREFRAFKELTEARAWIGITATKEG